MSRRIMVLNFNNSSILVDFKWNLVVYMNLSRFIVISFNWIWVLWPKYFFYLRSRWWLSDGFWSKKKTTTILYFPEFYYIQWIIFGIGLKMRLLQRKRRTVSVIALVHLEKNCRRSKKVLQKWNAFLWSEMNIEWKKNTLLSSVLKFFSFSEPLYAEKCYETNSFFYFLWHRQTSSQMWNQYFSYTTHAQTLWEYVRANDVWKSNKKKRFLNGVRIQKKRKLSDFVDGN